ncbi:MAG: AAA family ATPase, partial [Solirubrobacteraceae bacterium]
MIDYGRVPPGFGSPAKRRDFERLKTTLLERAESVCRHLYPAGRKEGDEWCVGSPFGEKGKSFKINIRKGVACEFNGGATIAGDMIAVWALATGVKQGEAYDDALKWSGDTSAPKSPPWPPLKPAPQKDDRPWWHGREPTRKHDYWDADGALWGTVKRWEDPVHGKDFRQSDAVGNPKLPSGPRPLYNLPAILKSSGPVILVEGEKCAEALNALGYVATTSIGGAGGVGKADWSPLKGRDIVRWADNDKAGAKWMEDTKALLQAAGVGAIRDVAIPSGKPDKWDCADADDVEARRLIMAAGSAPAVKRVIEATPYRPPAFDKIPKRRFIYDTIYQRGVVSVTAGEGGAGKSALHVAEALAIASGRDLLGTGKPIERCKVWMIALEDDRNEMDRRIAAAMIHFEIEWPQIDGWLHLSTGDEARKFILASDGRDGVELSEVSFTALRDGIVERSIGAVQMDPYIYLSTLNENDNNSQGALMGALKDLAQETQVAIALVHHAKKPNANDRGGPSAADIRGAGAIVNSARYGRTVNTMSAVDADKLGVDEEARWAYFRTTSVKANYAPGDRSGKWFKMHGVRLPNGVDEDDGDSVGVVTKWKAPDVFEAAGVEVKHLRDIQSMAEQAAQLGNAMKYAPQGDPFIGDLIA